MEKYKIYCTEEQLAKAVKLGLPIEHQPLSVFFEMDNMKYEGPADKEVYEQVTAEEMVGWLEEQEGLKSVVIDKTDKWQYVIWGSDGHPIWCDTGFNSRPEATLAAIDKTLEHLNNKK